MWENVFTEVLSIATIFQQSQRWSWNLHHLSNQSILEEISPGCSLEGMMLKLKFQYFGHLMRGVDSLEKTLMLGGIGGRMRRGWQRMRCLDGITDLMDVSFSRLRSWWWTGRPGVLRFMGSQRLSDWTEPNWTELNWTELNWTILSLPKLSSKAWASNFSACWSKPRIFQKSIVISRVSTTCYGEYLVNY